MALNNPRPIIERAIALSTTRPRARGPSPLPKRCQDIKAHNESDATVLTISALVNTGLLQPVGLACCVLEVPQMMDARTQGKILIKIIQPNMWRPSKSEVLSTCFASNVQSK
jgi:hypothetical protein